MGREGLASLEKGPLAHFGPVIAQERALPLVAELAGLFPDGGLRRGSTVVVGRSDLPGATSLALALLSGPSTDGSWCAVVGAPELGFVAAAQFGVVLERLVVVPEPGGKWAVVAAALLEGFDLVLLCLAGRADPAGARKLGARARERGAVLAVLGDDWPAPADMVLRVSSCRWQGLENGPGYLAGREVEVSASGRGAATRQRRARMWLGGPPLGLLEENQLAALSGHRVAPVLPASTRRP